MGGGGGFPLGSYSPDIVSTNNLFWRRMAFKYNTFMPYEPIKVSAKACLVNLTSSKPKKFSFLMLVPHVATKYDQISLEQILKSWPLCFFLFVSPWKCSYSLQILRSFFITFTICKIYRFRCCKSLNKVQLMGGNQVQVSFVQMEKLHLVS